MNEFVKIFRHEPIKFSIGGIIFILAILSFGSITGVFSTLYSLFPQVLTFLVFHYLFIWLFGGFMGKLCYKGKINIAIALFLITVLSVFIGTFFGGLTSYFLSFSKMHMSTFSDFVFYPMIGVFFWGSVPIFLSYIFLTIRVYLMIKKLK